MIVCRQTPHWSTPPITIALLLLLVQKLLMLWVGVEEGVVLHAAAICPDTTTTTTTDPNVTIIASPSSSSPSQQQPINNGKGGGGQVPATIIATIVVCSVIAGVGIILICVVYCLLWGRQHRYAPVDEDAPFTIVFTDIQSSTTLWAEAPEAMALGLDHHNALIRKLCNKYRGYEVKTIGDAFMVAFKDALDAIHLAHALQFEFLNFKKWKMEIDVAYLEMDHSATRSMSSEERAQYSIALSIDDYSKVWNGLRVRIGIHTGSGEIKKDPVSHGYDYYGTVVNTAVRTELIAHGGQIIMTEATLVAAKLPRSKVVSMGKVTLRWVPVPIAVFELKTIPGRMFPPLRIEHSSHENEEGEVLSSSHPSDDSASASYYIHRWGKEQQDEGSSSSRRSSGSPTPSSCRVSSFQYRNHRQQQTEFEELVDPSSPSPFSPLGSNIQNHDHNNEEVTMRTTTLGAGVGHSSRQNTAATTTATLTTRHHHHLNNTRYHQRHRHDTDTIIQREKAHILELFRTVFSVFPEAEKQKIMSDLCRKWHIEVDPVQLLKQPHDATIAGSSNDNIQPNTTTTTTANGRRKKSTVASILLSVTDHHDEDNNNNTPRNPPPQSSSSSLPAVTTTTANKEALRVDKLATKLARIFIHKGLVGGGGGPAVLHSGRESYNSLTSSFFGGDRGDTTTTHHNNHPGDSKSKRMAATSEEMGLLSVLDNLYLVPPDASIKHPTPNNKTTDAKKSQQ